MYLLSCVCATFAWFAVAAASIYSHQIRLFYASGFRLVLLVSTKFAGKAASIITLALWRDAAPSTFCKWYLPIDGAVLLWQAHVAPVGAVAQAMIAAADAACTFCCCWLLSDRWPYESISTGTVLAANLMLTGASLWLADRTEVADRRDYERALAAGAAKDGAASGAAAAGCARACASGAAACCGVAGCGCGCSSGAKGGGGATNAAVACGCGSGGAAAGLLKGEAAAMDSSTLPRVSVAADDAVATADSAPPPPPSIPQPPSHHHQQQQQQLQQQQDPQQQERVLGSMDEGCDCCPSGEPLFGPGTGGDGGGASSNGSTGVGMSLSYIGGGGDGGSGSGACVGTACSESSSPATLSSTRSLSRALPSFSIHSNCSTVGAGICTCGRCGSVTGCTEGGGSSRAASRPPSCIGARCGSRAAAGQQQQQQAPLLVSPAQAVVGAGEGTARGLRVAAAAAAAAMAADGGGAAAIMAAVLVAGARHARTSPFTPAAFYQAPGSSSGSEASADGAAPAGRRPPASGAAEGAAQPGGRRVLAGLLPSLALWNTDPGEAARTRRPGSEPQVGSVCGHARMANMLLAGGGSESYGAGDDTPQAGVQALAAAAAVAPPEGAGPLRQLRRLVQHWAAIAVAAESPAAASAPSLPAADPVVTYETRCSTTASGAAASTSGPISVGSTASRTSEPRLCSYQRQESVAAARCVHSSACGAAAPAPAVLHSACRDEPSAGAQQPGPDASSAAAQPSWGESCAPDVAPMAAHTLVSADCVLAHPLHLPDLADPLAQLRREQRSPMEPPQLRDLVFSVLSADPAAPSQQHWHEPLATAPRPAGAAGGGAALAADEATAPAPARSEHAPSGGARAAAPAAAVAAAATAASAAAGSKAVALSIAACAGAPTDAQPLASGDGGASLSAAAGAVGLFNSIRAPASDTVDARTPRSFTLARALVARGGSNAMYDMPVLHHTRCSIKLAGLTPADLSNGFADRVASLLAAVGGSAATASAAASGNPVAATAAAAVGLYVREGCVEVVADVLVPSSAAAVESAVVGLAAAASAGARGADVRGDGGGAGGAAVLARVLAVAEASAGLAPPQLQASTGIAATAPPPPLNLDRTSAEAMLDFLERSLLPEINGIASRAQAQEASPPLLGGVALQATVGGTQLVTWRAPQALAPTAPPPPPPPTIVCVTPCCVPLYQASNDDTRDRRRQTVTLTVALAGARVSFDVAQPPRVMVRHSGRCLAAAVRPCAERYVGCLAVTVELALSGLRPGLLFLEVSAARDSAGSSEVQGDPAAAAVLSLPWPVLVVGDSRVAVEVQQLQQQMEAAAPLRALQAEMELERWRQQQRVQQPHAAYQHPAAAAPPPLLLPPQPQQQLDVAASSLLVDLGMWFEAVSAVDALVIATALGEHQTPVDAVRGHPPAPPSAAPPLPLLLTPPVTASALGHEDDADDGDQGYEKGTQAQAGIEEDGGHSSGDESIWESSDEHSLLGGEEAEGHDADAVITAAEAGPVGLASASSRCSRTADRPTLESPPPLSPAAAHSRVGSPCDHNVRSVGAEDDAAAEVPAAGSEAEAQMLLLRGLQPEQELLDGSLDCAAEYEQTCRRGAALQSAAANLGMRLLRFAVLRGWPAAATLLLRGLLMHCRLGFEDVKRLFPGAGGMPLLHTAVMSGSLAMVRAVKAWAQRYRCALPWDEPIEGADAAGRGVGGGGSELTPLHLAAVQEGGRLAGAILGLWPDAETQWAVVRDRDGRTPQDYAYMRAITSHAGSSGASASGRAAVAVAAAAALPPSDDAATARHNQLSPQPRQVVAGGGLPGLYTQDGYQRGRSVGVPTQRLQPELQPQPQPQPQFASQGPAGASPPSVPVPVPVTAVGQGLIVTGAPKAGRPSPPCLSTPPPLPQDAVRHEGVGGGAVATAAAATGLGLGRGDGPGSGASSVFTTSLPVYGNCPGRWDRTSDCGSLSMGPDSQWSHSTNATAQTQCNHQDLRGGHSPLQAGTHHTMNAMMLSLANLPDLGRKSIPNGAAGCDGDGATDSAAARAATLFDEGDMIAPLRHQQQLTQSQRSHQQLRRVWLQQQLLHPEPGRAMGAQFQLELTGGGQKAAQPQPPTQEPSSQMQQQPLLPHHPYQQRQLPPTHRDHPTGRPGGGLPGLPSPCVHIGSSGGGGSYEGVMPRCLTPSLMLRQQQQQQQQQRQLQEHPRGLALPLPPVCPCAQAGPPCTAVGYSTAAAARSAAPRGAASLTTPRGGGSRGEATGGTATPAAACGIAVPFHPVGWGAAAAPAPAAAAAVPPAAVAALPPPPPGDATSGDAAAPPPQQSPPQARKAATPPPLPQLATPSRVSTRGMRLLATSLLGDAEAPAVRPRASSRTSSAGSRSSTAPVAAGGGYTSTSYSTLSTAASIASTQSPPPSVAAARRRLSADGRFSANTRRAAFADDYAPVCQPSLAARTADLSRLVPLLAAARRRRAMGDGGDDDDAAAAAITIRTMLLAARRAPARTTAAAAGPVPNAPSIAIGASTSSGSSTGGVCRASVDSTPGGAGEGLEGSLPALAARRSADAGPEEGEEVLMPGSCLSRTQITGAAKAAAATAARLWCRAPVSPKPPPARHVQPALAAREDAAAGSVAVPTASPSVPLPPQSPPVQPQRRQQQRPQVVGFVLLAGLVLLAALFVPALTGLLH